MNYPVSDHASQNSTDPMRESIFVYQYGDAIRHYEDFIKNGEPQIELPEQWEDLRYDLKEEYLTCVSTLLRYLINGMTDRLDEGIDEIIDRMIISRQYALEQFGDKEVE